MSFWKCTSKTQVAIPKDILQSGQFKARFDYEQ